MNYPNIEEFYSQHNATLYGQELRPCKSIVKDVENCFADFKRYYLEGNRVLSKKDVPQIVGREVDENTRNQNIRVMTEFGFLMSVTQDKKGAEYTFTNKFENLISSNLPLGIVVLEALYKVRGLSDLNMYLNFLLCTLREAYVHGKITLFPDSKDKFIARVPNKELRDRYRKNVFELYGFIGDTRRPEPHSIEDEYTPNISYMSRTELENLGLLVKGDKENGLDTLVLTANGHHLLAQIDNRIGKNGLLDVDPLSLVERDGFVSNSLTPIILYGPPGTGKTWKLQNKYLRRFNGENTEFATFHQSFSYEEFVEGLKPTLDNKDISYNIETGVFYRICETAAKLAGYDSLNDSLSVDKSIREETYAKAIEDGRIALLCIDEINRGNVASIFGDLISLIEPSKRLGAKDELILTLPYSKKKFGVPANLMIVGTMNTADRSIQLLDSALRRRFRFEEMPPKYEVIKNDTARDVLKAINKRIRAILNKDAQIGHAYFVDASNDLDTLKALVDKVIPLLEEYFYNDVEKIRYVLNDKDDNGLTFYVEDKEATEAFEALLNMPNSDYVDSEGKQFYQLNEETLKALIATGDLSDYQNAPDFSASKLLGNIIK